MNHPNLLFNEAGRLRSGWRFLAFCFGFILVMTGMLLVASVAVAFILPRDLYKTFFESNVGFLIQGMMMFLAAAPVGWVCGYVFEDLPWRALGWAAHTGWARDLLLGILLGTASIFLAVGICVLAGGTQFTLAPASLFPSVAKTLVFSAVIFLVGAAAEEMLFRGYPLQTLMRSLPLWLAVLPVSIVFALVHFSNPNVVRGFTLINTTLAGVWLAVAYWKTRSLWFPLGLHWSWNWIAGALLGEPVSGIESITPEPLLRAVDLGPAWLTGGEYGPEGGAACTVALVLATAFIARTRLVSATPEMKQYTDRDVPNQTIADQSVCT
jgi:membrane protease YdiL (CAAX protease family)